MKGSLSLLAVFCALLVGLMASDVMVLTNDNFDQALEENNVLLVEFYAPWCGHCKTLAPKYEEAATKLKGTAKIAKVDCTEQDAVCQKFGVRGYPTLKLFRDGKPSEYKAAREVDALVGFMKKQTLPAVSTLEGDKLQEFIDAEKVAVIGFFKSEEDKEYKAFSEAADLLREEFIFGVTTDAKAASAQDVTPPAVVIFKKFDEGKSVFDGSYSKNELKSFINANAVPTMDDIGPENYANYVESGLPLAYLFTTPDDRSTVGPLVEAVAKKLKGKMNFVYIDANKFGSHANNLGLTVGEWPAFSVQFPKENTKYPFVGDIATDAIEKFANSILSGEAKPFLKSQDVPKEQGNLKVVVGNNYKDIMGQGKDVLIEFYAPWCGHCKKLAPTFDELADFYANEENLIIAKMDSTENDLPLDSPIQVQGFPTIKFVKKDGTILDYNGDRSLEDFKKFIQENASVKPSAKADKDEL